MAREVTCIFIAIYTTILVVGVVRLAQGRAAYDAFLAALASPASIVFHLLALGFALYHSVTWFNLAPKALPIHVGDKTVPPAAIAIAHYVAFVAIAIIVLVLAGAL
jgi:fumarate reductase subunit C